MQNDNMPAKSHNWAEYYDKTRNMPPRSLLITALRHVKNKNKAIDIGGGALHDTRYLLNLGFEVTVIDNEPLLAKETEHIKSDRLNVHVTSFEDFEFGVSKYDLASAMYALPFNPPASFADVFNNIKQSLVKDGIFCGQLFGINDTWSTNSKMTFHTKEQIEKLLKGMEIIQLTEEDEDGKTANGQPKHWHLFHVIARKL